MFFLPFVFIFYFFLVAQVQQVDSTKHNPLHIEPVSHNCNCSGVLF